MESEHMLQQPKTETDRLANVIQVLQLGKKTGVLIVERNNGPNAERGIITLVNGQIKQASVGQRQGQDAVAWLENWGLCRFSFSTEQKRNRADNPSQLPTPPPPKGARGYSSSFTSPLPITTPGLTSSPQQTFTGTTGNGSLMPTIWGTTPFRTRHIEEGMRVIEQMGFSRAHRRLFLLIDGKRTLQDLVRLLTNESTEVYRLLKDLERAGVVQA
jgi:uncharacterized protein DUF4388